MTTRELTTAEMFYYQVFNHLPTVRISNINNSFSDFGKEITKGLLGFFHEKDLPELILEPGRCIASPNQFLLLTVHLTKYRSGTSKWLITDGGLGTVTMPTYYEFHDIFLCNDVFRREAELATIIGPCCFAADIVYKNKKMPKIHS